MFDHKHPVHIIQLALPRLPRGVLACFRGYADCVDGAIEKGVIYGMGVYEKGKVKDTAAMKEAYEMGRTIQCR